ncbi:hypothetical protein KPH14_001661 [Odynerus spinipes]|uniref:Icarapin-like n=1 Tax=Odynerus spinipes TaxID=1348599 RepID=A0AAD9VWQ0_9HYME|nr:hypothetical protein KPH14_001661 [Odynerus spinipes]
MRLLVSALLVSAYFVACAHAFPAIDTSDESSEKKNVDTVLVLPGPERDLFGRPRISGIPDTSDFDVDDSDESWSFFRPNYPNMYFDYLSQYLQNLMKRLRDQMSDMASHLPSGPSFIRPWKIPEGANTTSTTKVIDGHVVTINETIYSDGNDNEGTFIRVRVIDVKPQNETTEAPSVDGETEPTLPTTIGNESDNKEEVTTPLRSVETVEEFDNEIPKSQGDTLTA